MPGRAVTIFLAATALVLDIALPASAHYPHSDGWDWTCVGGMPSTGFEGSCNGMSWADPPSHAANAEIHFYYETSIGAYGYTSQVTIGYSAWDETDGHEFNYIRESTDTSSNVNISVVNGTICGNPSSWGCTSAAPTATITSRRGPPR